MFWTPNSPTFNVTITAKRLSIRGKVYIGVRIISVVDVLQFWTTLITSRNSPLQLQYVVTFVV